VVSLNTTQLSLNSLKFQVDSMILVISRFGLSLNLVQHNTTISYSLIFRSLANMWRASVKSQQEALVKSNGQSVNSNNLKH
jgi:hypothetical protein